MSSVDLKHVVMNYSSMEDELEVEEVIKEKADEGARDQFGAGMVELVVPTVDDELISILKMRFDSLDEWYIFYKNYALVAGFGIREHNSKKSSDGDYLVRREFVCCKQGKKKVDANSKPNRKCRRVEVRSDWKAKLVPYKGIDNEKSVVTFFHE